MKRSSHSFKKRPRINWGKCYPCQEAKGESLRNTEAGINSLTANLLFCWKHDLLEFDPSTEVCYENGEPDFKAAFKANKVKYHHSCAAFYNTKAKRYEKKFKNMQSSKERITTRYIDPMESMITDNSSALNIEMCHCPFCSEFDNIINMCAAGSYHANNKKVDAKHNEELTKRWREMALLVGNQKVLQMLAQGDLAANDIFYHEACYKAFVKEYNRVLKQRIHQQT